MTGPPPPEVEAEPSPRGLIALVTTPSGWHRIKLFGASARAEHFRRRPDLIIAAWYLIALAVVLPAARTVDGAEAALARTIDALPDLIEPLAALPYDIVVLWAATTLVLALVRRHWRLAASMALAIPLAVAVTIVLNRALGIDDVSSVATLGAPVDGVPAQLLVGLAVAQVAARELSRPFRIAGRRLGLLAALGAVFLPVTAPYRVLCAVLGAGLVASVIRFALGSPRTTVSPTDVRRDLLDLGVDAHPVDGWADGHREAVTTDGGRLAVRVLGRDEWDTEFVVTLWRVLWYRNSGRTLRLSARQQIEHHAFLLLLAQARGVPVTPLAAAGVSRTGDALVASSIDGPTLADLDHAVVDDDLLNRAWRTLADLHDAGVTHTRIDPAALIVGRDGTVRLGSFDGAEPLTRIDQVRADQAQLLVSTALTVGPERAIAVALAAIDEDAPAGVVAHLQEAALDDGLRRAVDHADLSLEDLRAALADAAGIEIPELQKIRRVSWGSLLKLVLIGVVAYILISQLADIGFDTIIESMQAASLPILIVALFLGQVPRVAQAAGKQAASPAPLPLWRLTKLEFATCFVNLAMPSTAARAAMSIRFFQRSGATAAGAVSAGALDSVFGFIAQIGLLLACVLLGLGTLGYHGGTTDIDTSTIWTVVIASGVAIAIAIAVVALVPKLRAKVVDFVGQLREALNVLRSPSLVVRLLGFNVLANLLFTLTMWTVLQAFGQEVRFADVLIINMAVALFAGIIPVPGGVGVTEGALTAGFVAAGVPHDIAFSAALCYRICTYYLPPIWGYVAFSQLRRDRFL